MRIQGEKGQALAEMVVILPIILLLLLSVMDFVRVCGAKVMLDMAAVEVVVRAEAPDSLRETDISSQAGQILKQVLPEKMGDVRNDNVAIRSALMSKVKYKGYNLWYYDAERQTGRWKAVKLAYRTMELKLECELKLWSPFGVLTGADGKLMVTSDILGVKNGTV